MKNNRIIILMWFLGQFVFAQAQLMYKPQVLTNFYAPNPNSLVNTPISLSAYNWQDRGGQKQGVIIDLHERKKKDIYIEAGNSKIRFSRSLNPNEPMFKVVVQIDNGTPFEILSNSASIFDWDCSGKFTNIGTYNLYMEITLNSGIVSINHTIHVVEESDGILLESNYYNTMRYWKGIGNNNIPLILSVGYDPYNIKPEQYYRYAGNELVNCLNAQGYDVYILYYRRNSQNLKNNAAVYASAINKLYSVYGKKVVAAGMSMGGLISRFAVAKAEHLGNPLPISKWVSIDAPHQGAFISSSFQEYLEAEYPSNSFKSFAIENRAAKILLEFNVYDDDGTLRNSFMNELNSFNNSTGYPQRIPKIGISFSTNTPNPNSIGDVWLDIDVTGGSTHDFTGRIGALEKRAGSFLPKIESGTDFLFFILLYPITVTVSNPRYPCFMPHNSTLDIDVNGLSPFTEIYVANNTRHHDVVPIELVAPIVNSIKFGKNRFIQDELIIDNSFNAHVEDLIEMGINVNSNLVQGDVIIDSNEIVEMKSGGSILIDEGVTIGRNFLAKNEVPVLITCN